MQARPQKRLLMGERAPLAKLRVERVRLPLAGMPPAKALAALARPQARRSWWGLAAEPAREERDLPMTELSRAAMKAMAQAGPVRVPIHEGRRAHEKPDHEGRRSSGWKPSRKRTELLRDGRAAVAAETEAREMAKAGQRGFQRRMAA